MNRLLRRYRNRTRKSEKISVHSSKLKSPVRSTLVAEQLENRLLLTTLILPEGATSETIFSYADPEENDPGEEVTVYNEIHIGTLSGEPPSQDVIVEILDYQGNDIGGTYSIGINPEVQLFGGPAGGPIIDEVPIDVARTLNEAISALATDSTGTTYGLTNTGTLVKIDTATGEVEQEIGRISDTDHPGTNTAITYTDFESATFMKNSGGADVLCAVVTAPLTFDSLGNPSSMGPALITISTATTTVNGIEVAESGPMGRNAAGQPDYSASELELFYNVDDDAGTVENISPDIRTIVFSQEGHNVSTTTDSPVFIGYDTISDRFLTINVTTSPAGGSVVVQTQVFADVDAEDIVISGLAYDDQGRLFGLHHTIDDVEPALFAGDEAVFSDGKLVMVDFYAPVDERFVDVVEYGTVLIAGAEVDIVLTGMSFDSVNGMGYATDPHTATLYTVNMARLVTTEDGNDFTITGLSDIYTMYVAQCTADTYITITRFTINDDGTKDYTPTSGEPAYLFMDEDDAEIYTPDEAGGVMIGTRPGIIDPDSDEITWSPGDVISEMDGTFFSSTVTAPDPGVKGAWPGGALRPGIVVAATNAAGTQNNDIGKIQIGGGVFGDVDIRGGGIGTFYAGYLGTNNFYVAGDLQSIAINTQTGGIEESDGAWATVGTPYYGGDGVMPILDVGGSLGNFYSKGDWGLPIRVEGRSDAPEFAGVLDVDSDVYVKTTREIERKLLGDPKGSFFPDGVLETDGGYIITNDTPQTAQFLGTVDGIISVTGEAESVVWDFEDYYSFGVMAGQTIEIRLFNTEGTHVQTNFLTGHPGDPNSQEISNGGVSLLDPSLITVGTLGEYDIETLAPLPLSFTAEQAGIYTVVVSSTSLWSYRLEVSGVSETSLGGGNVLTDLRNGKSIVGSYESPVVQALSGNIGGLSIGNIARSSQISVENGDIAGLRAGFNDGDFGFSWEVADNGAPLLPHPTIKASGDIGMVSSPVNSMIHVTAGGDIQSLQMGESYAGTLTADGNIGEVSIAADFGPVVPFEDGGLWFWVGDNPTGGIQTGIWANADGIGEPGIIDRIYVGGEFGSSFGFMYEIPVSAGGQGGNVRFVDIVGSIHNTIGAWTDVSGFGPFDFDPGQAVEIVDDSGVLVRIAPGYTGPDEQEVVVITTTDDTGTGIPVDDGTDDTTDEEVVDEGGVLTVKLLPIRDQLPADYVPGGLDIAETLLGYAIVSVDSTDGLRVSSSGGPAEMGVVTVSGVEDNAVIFNGSNAVSVLRLNVTPPTVTDSGTDTGDEQNQQAAVTETSGITRIVNNTKGGDMVSIVIAATADDEVDFGDGGGDSVFEIIRINGHLGWTSSSTGQIIETVELVAAAEISATNPIGSQRSGLVSVVGIKNITITGSLGDSHIAGDVTRITVNSDNSLAAGQFDGLAGAVLVVGELGFIDLGDGIAHPGRGTWALSGLFVEGDLNRVEIKGAGRDINGPIIASGDINYVLVSNGARIVGYNGLGGAGDRMRGSHEGGLSIGSTQSFDNFNAWARVSSGSIGTIQVSGEGSEIRGGNIAGLNLTKLIVTSGAEGMFYSRLNFFMGSTADTGIIGSVIVGGEGIHDSIIVAGRDLKSIKVLKGGSISYSEIRGTYHVGSVTADNISYTDVTAYNRLEKVTVSGDILDIEIEAGELGQLTAKGDILGSAIFVGGELKKITAGGDLISTIQVTGPYGDLKSVKVGGDFGTPVGGIIIVDGQIGTISVKGDFEAELLLNWDPVANSVQYAGRKGVELKKLTAGGDISLSGDIGGDVGTIQANDDFGNIGDELHIHGDLKTFKLGSSRSAADLRSDLIVDGSLGNVTVYGSADGDINVAEDFKSLTLKATSGDRADLNGNVIVGGSFSKLTIYGGDQYGDVIAQSKGPKVTIRGSDILGNMVIGGSEEPLTIDGSITQTGKYLSTGDVSTLHIKGNIDEEGILYVDGDLDKLIVDGSIEGTVHVTGNIGTIIAGNMGLVDTLGINATVTAGGSIGDVRVGGTIKDGYVLAGFDPGIGEMVAGLIDGTLSSSDFEIDDASDVSNRDALKREFGIDGTAIDPDERAMSGDLKKISVGILNNSVIAAGVSPGSNKIFGDVDGSDSPGVGNSYVGTVVIDALSGDGSAFGVFADASIRSLKVGGSKMAVPLLQPSGFRAWTISEPSPSDIDGFGFSSGLPVKMTVGPVGSERLVTVSLSGPGFGEVLFDSNGDIETIQLNDTTEKTSVKVMAQGASTVNVGQLFTGDDDSLNSLTIDGLLANSTMDGSLYVGGNLKSLTLGGIGVGSEITVGGDVSRANLGVVSGTSTYETDFEVVGSLDQLQADEIGYFVTIVAENISKITVKGDMDGSVVSNGGVLKSVSISGDMDGVVSNEGDIEKIQIKGETSGGIRAGGDIKTFDTASMYCGAVAAGGDFGQARIKGDVEYSTISAGLDIGVDGDPFSQGDVISGRGDLDKVRIGGDFIASNISAGIAPGEDNMFGTADDTLEEKAAEDSDAPRVKDITINYTAGGVDFDTIKIEFMPVSQGKASNIGSVTITGEVTGSSTPTDSYAIIASGEIGSVIADRQAFSRSDNVALSTIDGKDILSSTLEADPIGTLAAALAAGMRVQTDGLDHIFGSEAEVQANTVDDVIMFGDDVWVEFDAANNSVLFHKESGFVSNNEGSNYYKVTLDASVVTNRMGVELDGEYYGQVPNEPSGDGVPGGDFVYYFAVADIGSTAITAFSPFSVDFPENTDWFYEEILGNDQANPSNQAMLDEDYIRMNGLQEGQILTIDLENLSGSYNQWWWQQIYGDMLQLDLLLVEESDFSADALVDVLTIGALDDFDPARDLVAANLDEITFSGGVYYGYENQGQQFYSLDRSSLAVELLANNLDDLNTLPEVVTEGNITGLKALAGHVADTLWAIAEFQPNSGTSRESLVLIQNLGEDINGSGTIQTEVVLSSYDVGGDFTNIVALAELDGTLYGIDGAGNTLVTFVSDANDADFGKASVVGNGAGNLGNDELTITGLAVDPDGTGLLALHDHGLNDFDNLLNDGLYQIDVSSGSASLWHELSYGDQTVHGLAVEPGGAITVGIPLRGSAAGDTINITYAFDTEEHVLGGTSEASFEAGLITVTSNSSEILENLEGQSFIDGGFYYGLEINYETSGLGNITLELSDIDWWTTDAEGLAIIASNSQVASVVSDDPDNVTVSLGGTLDEVSLELEPTVSIEIDTENGDGSVVVYFAGTGQLAKLIEADLELAGPVIGIESRDDMSPVRDMILPDMGELAIATEIFASKVVLEMTGDLEAALEQPTVSRILDTDGQLDEELYFQIVVDIMDEAEADRIALLNDFINGLTVTTFDAVGYDCEQEIFALLSSTSIAVEPIIVDDPNNPSEEVPLTLDVLNDIYQQTVSHVTINSIVGLEFGTPAEEAETPTTTEFFNGFTLLDNADLNSIMSTYSDTEIAMILNSFESFITADVDELLAITEVTTTDTDSTRNSLALIGDITDPAGTIEIATNSMENDGFNNVTELAFGILPDNSDNTLTDAWYSFIFGDEIIIITADGLLEVIEGGIQNLYPDADSGILYGLDAASQTLIVIDYRQQVRNEDNNLINNTNFGAACPLAGELNNLGNAGGVSFDITAMDFDSEGRLLAIENSSNNLVEINTTPFATGESYRLELMQYLPEGDYQAMSYNSHTVGGIGFVVRTPDGSPLGDSVDLTVTAGSTIKTGSHILGSSDTTVNTVTVSSNTGNSPQDVIDAGGFYRLDIDYLWVPGDQGDIELTISDIDWLNGRGDVDSVIISDKFNVAVTDFGGDTLTLLIDSHNSVGALTVYFGATSDLLIPDTGQIATTMVSTTESFLFSSIVDDTTNLTTQIPKDGDYLLRISDGTPLLFYDGSSASPIAYNLNIELFNDGNSDFGVSQTASGQVYDQVVPGNSAIDLGPGSTDLVVDSNHDDVFYYENEAWPIEAKGTLLTPGVAGELVIDAQLGCVYDVDVYTVQLTEGQRITIDIDASILFGRDNVEVIAGIYNGDLESIAVALSDPSETLPQVQQADTYYTAQAVFTIGKDGGTVEIDPSENGVGTYYIVVSNVSDRTTGSVNGSAGTVNEGEVPYRLTITTSDSSWTDKELDEAGLNRSQIDYNNVIIPESQLVYLSFGDSRENTNTSADYLVEMGAGWSADVAERPAFFTEDEADLFGLDANLRDELIAAIAARIEQVYRDAGLSEDEIKFVTEKPVSGQVYSTVIFGGRLPVTGIAGLAENVDRHNAERDDMAVILTEEIGLFRQQYLDEDTSDRFDEIVNQLANTGAHELGHILGLEHATEVNVSEPNNLMNYNSLDVDMGEQAFEERNGYWYQPIGFTNEIDSLLRNIGSGTPMGS